MPRAACTLLCLAVAATAVACAPSDDAATDTATVAPPATAAPPPAAGPLANAAGTWNVVVRTEAGDSVTAYTLQATSNTSGWMVTLPGRDPQPANVSISGDSIITVVGPFESVMRPGVQVTTRSALLITGDRIEGPARARYEVTGPDTVTMLRMVGTRAP